MGGSRSQPKQQQQQQPSGPDPMIMFMAQQQQATQAAADAEAERQRQAQIQAQQQAGMQAQQQGEQSAVKALANMNTGQQTQDQAALATQKPSNVGAGMDAGITRQTSLQQMGAVTPVQQGMGGSVSQAANIGAGGTQQRANMFSVPTTTGLTFGGA